MPNFLKDNVPMRLIYKMTAGEDGLVSYSLLKVEAE